MSENTFSSIILAESKILYFVHEDEYIITIYNFHMNYSQYTATYCKYIFCSVYLYLGHNSKLLKYKLKYMNHIQRCLSETLSPRVFIPAQF